MLNIYVLKNSGGGNSLESHKTCIPKTVIGVGVGDDTLVFLIVGGVFSGNPIFYHQNHFIMTPPPPHFMKIIF